MGSVLQRRHTIPNKTLLWIFVIYGILIFIQNAQVFMYFDDYGYASLSYAVDVGVTGTNYGLGDIFNFLGKHYITWGGRICSFFVEIVLLKCGLWTIRIVQTIITVWIALYSYKIASMYISEKKNFLIAVLICSLYFLIPQVVLRNGIYWYTASCLYFWPLALILPAIYIFLQKKISRGKLVLLCALFFFGGASYEQTGIILPSFAVLYMIIQGIRKQKVFAKRIILPLVFGIAGYAFLFLAPGNFVRMEMLNSDPLTAGTILYRLGLLFFPPNFKGEWNWIPILCMVGCILAALTILRGSNKNKIMKIGSLTIIMVSTFFLLIYCFYPLMASYREFGGILNLLCVVVLVLTIVLYFIRKKQVVLISLLGAALASQLMMIFVPVIHDRTCIMFLFIIFIFMSIIYYDFILSAKRKALNLVYLLPLIIAMAMNYGTITNGYWNNAPYHEQNHIHMEQAVEEYQNGNLIQQIEIYRLPNDFYAGTMPYDMEAGDGTRQWMLEYYGLPNNIQFQYIDPNIQM